MAQGKSSLLMGVSTLLGSLVFGAAVVQAPAQVTPSAFPPLDPAQVECPAFRPASSQLCYTTANDLHQLFEFVVELIEADDVPTAIQETLPSTPLMFPDGTVVYGVEGFGVIVARWAASSELTFGPVSYTFRYRSLNRTTVVAYGIITFTIEDHEHSTTRVIESVQTELFRRNPQMPRGWEQVYEQLAYTQPLLSDRP